MFQVGDVVVCVDDTKSRPDQLDIGLKLNRIYRVGNVGQTPISKVHAVGVIGLEWKGRLCLYAASRFRKIQPASKEFINSIRRKVDA